MNTLEAARNFFLNLKPYHPEDIMVNMNLAQVMALINFGHRMVTEAQTESVQYLLTGMSVEANACAKDVTTICKNLNSVEKAYKLMMN